MLGHVVTSTRQGKVARQGAAQALMEGSLRTLGANPVALGLGAAGCRPRDVEALEAVPWRAEEKPSGLRAHCRCVQQQSSSL